MRRPNLSVWFKKKKPQEFPVNVDLNRGFAFIHIPKNAGTSLSKSFGFKSSSHATYRDLEREIGSTLNDLFVFAFVRNPFDRFLSLYHYARMEESMYHSARDPKSAPFGKHLDYDKLVNASVEQCADLLIEGKLEHDHSWNHWNPQVFWLYNNENQIVLDFIGRTDQLSKDLAILSTKIPISKEVSSLNRSANRRDYRSEINPRTKSILEEYYKEDLEQFDFKF